MAKIKVYTKDNCPYCHWAKELLDSKNVVFEEVALGSNVEKIMALAKETGMRTLPQIFIDDQLIGGYDDLKSMDDSGKLDEILNS